MFSRVRAIGRLQRLRGSYQRVFVDSPSGRDVLADLARKFGGMTYVPNDPGGRKTAFAEGQRYVLRHIASLINLSDADLMTLASEETNDGNGDD